MEAGKGFKLEEIGKEYNDIISNAGLGLWHIILKDGCKPRMQVNGKMAELLDIDVQVLSEEQIYSSWYERITPGAVPSVQASVQEMMDGKFSENTYLWNHPEKGDIYVRCGGTSQELEDGTHVLSGYHADVTNIVLEEQRYKEKVEFQLKLNRALSSDYANVFLIDKKNGTFEPLKIADEVIEKLGMDKSEKYSYIESCDKFIFDGVNSDDAGKMKECMKLEYVCEKLEKADDFTGNFRSVENHHYRFKYRKIKDTDYILLGFLNIDNLVAEEEKRNHELKLVNDKLEASVSEQEAQIDEIRMLNVQLQDKQSRLEEASAEQEAQLEEILTLNSQLEKINDEITTEKERVSEAYGIIEGFSQEYHTIWLVSKETRKMRLIRSTGVSTVKNAVQMGKDYPDFDTGFNKYIETYVEPEDRERMHREIAIDEILRQLEQSNFYSVNYLRRDESNHVGYHQIAFANADTESGVKQFVYGFRDIDEIVKEEQKQKEEFKKAKEAAEAANDAKTSFLFNMSHDIRTPMNAIIGFRDLLEKHQEDPEKRADYLAKIEESSNVLLSIINNVLEMARIEKGSLVLDETAWSTEQFNDTLYSIFAEMMQQKDITFTRQINVRNNYVFCDPIKLREVFINILSNAYKYTNPGGRVNMQLEEIPSDREGYALYQTTISDTGIGMNEDFLPHLFEEFSRENNTTDNKIEGTGLGMPIVKRLVDFMEGTIEVHSKKGEGTTFIITIPHRIAEKSNLVKHGEAEYDPNLFVGKRILLAEDNDFNAEISTEILEEAGFEVDRAEDGNIVCKKLLEEDSNYYDIILMDIQMPNMNGYDATKQIRIMQDKEKADIPIIAMTANAFEEDKKNAIKAGMNGHLAKPVRVNELMKEIARVL